MMVWGKKLCAWNMLRGSSTSLLGYGLASYSTAWKLKSRTGRIPRCDDHHDIIIMTWCPWEWKLMCIIIIVSPDHNLLTTFDIPKYILPFAVASFEGPSQWPVSPGQWRRVHAEPALEWQHHGPAGAWQRRSSGWDCRPCSRDLQTAGGWQQEASGAPAHTGLCRKGPLSLLECCLYNGGEKVGFWLRQVKR